jgi:hypothetical protein
MLTANSVLVVVHIRLTGRGPLLIKSRLREISLHHYCGARRKLNRDKLKRPNSPDAGAGGCPRRERKDRILAGIPQISCVLYSKRQENISAVSRVEGHIYTYVVVVSRSCMYGWMDALLFGLKLLALPSPRRWIFLISANASQSIRGFSWTALSDS